MNTTSNEWKRIPRKLRAGLVQISSYGKPTISAETANELVRRGWVKQGIRHIHIRRGNSVIKTDVEYAGFVLTFEGAETIQLCPTFLTEKAA